MLGQVKGLTPFYRLLNTLFRFTLTPRGGDSDNISHRAKNLLVQMAPGKRKFAVMEFIWNEIISCSSDSSSACLGRWEWRRRPRPVAGDRGELKGAEAGRLATARRRGGEWGDRNHPITEAVNAQSAPHGRHQNCRCGKCSTTKLLDCSFVVRLVGYGLARKDSRI